MYAVYVIYSYKLNRFYIGTSDDVQLRLIQHNSGEKKDAFTYRGIPWEIYLTIDQLESKQAYQIESYLKRMKSSAYIKKLKTNPDMVEWLRAKFI